MGYKITDKDNIKRNNLWDAETEALIALLAKNLERRGFKPTKVVQELNYIYLRKRKITKLKNCSATAMQRCILKNLGY